MSARDYTLTEPGTLNGHRVRYCPSTHHVWDSPDGFVPEEGQVTCRVCPATARAIPEGQLDRLLRQVTGNAVGAAQLVLRAALEQALKLTPPAGDAPPSDAAVLATFWGAVRALPPVPVGQATPAPVQEAEPDCACGHPAAIHVWAQDFANQRYCDDLETDCACMAYTPKPAAPESTCGLTGPEVATPPGGE